MPVRMIWDDEKTIVRCMGEGKWTWDEYHATLGEIVEAFKLVDGRVDLINHARGRFFHAAYSTGEARHYLAPYLFRGDDPFKPVSASSWRTSSSSNKGDN